jgi:ABC-2 type transport system permease protein
MTAAMSATAARAAGISLSPYLAVLRARFLLTLQYRAAAAAGFATQAWFGVIMVMVLAGFYHGAGRAPLSLSQAIGYVWLGQGFLVLLPWAADPEVSDMVVSGAVAYERLRPLDTYFYWYARALAWTLARVLPRATPMFLLAGLILPLVGLGAWSLHPPASLSAAALFAASVTLTFFLSAAITLLINVIVVLSLTARGANTLVAPIVNLFSGLVAPLPLFPAWMRGFLFLQPFAGLADIPFRIYVGQLTGPMALAGLALQALWVVMLVALGHSLLNRAMGRLQVQGG